MRLPLDEVDEVAERETARPCTAFRALARTSGNPNKTARELLGVARAPAPSTGTDWLEIVGVESAGAEEGPKGIGNAPRPWLVTLEALAATLEALAATLLETGDARPFTADAMADAALAAPELMLPMAAAAPELMLLMAALAALITGMGVAEADAPGKLKPLPMKPAPAPGVVVPPNRAALELEAPMMTSAVPTGSGGTLLVATPPRPAEACKEAEASSPTPNAPNSALETEDNRSASEGASGPGVSTGAGTAEN